MTEHSKDLRFLLFLAGLAAGLGGCSTLGTQIPPIGGAPSETSGPAAAEGVYYTASPDLPLHRSPGGVIIKRLPQYTKLYRDQVDRGFAHVRAESTGETGWVENAQLIWRLPKHKPSQQAHEPQSQAAEELPLPQAVEPPPSSAPLAVESSPQPGQPPASHSPQPVEPPPSPSPSTTPTKGTVTPSIFNPY